PATRRGTGAPPLPAPSPARSGRSHVDSRAAGRQGIGRRPGVPSTPPGSWLPRTVRGMVMDMETTDHRRQARGRRLAGARTPRMARRDRELWRGESAAIYCRISHVRDQDQTGVDRQERICRAIAKRLGLVVDAVHVFVDNNRSAWQRNRKRKGWDELLEALQSNRVRHVVAYHPDRLMRQPRDLEELLAIADERDITLHGEANQRDLSDPDDRYFLRIEVAHACRSSDDTSRRLKDAMVERAHDGKPHA